MEKSHSVGSETEKSRAQVLGGTRFTIVTQKEPRVQ